MSISRTFNLTLPAGLNSSDYDAVVEFAIKLSDPNDASQPWKSDVWFSFTAAWLSYASRLRSAAEYSDEFVSLLEHGTSPPREEQYQQERALFGCITSTLSAVECFYLAAYSLAGAVYPSNFPLEKGNDLRRYPNAAATAFERVDPQDTFSLELRETANSSGFESLSHLRNRLAHRGMLARKVYLSTVSDVPAAVPSNPMAIPHDFIHNAHLGRSTTADHVALATENLAQLNELFVAFLSKRVPS